MRKTRLFVFLSLSACAPDPQLASKLTPTTAPSLPTSGNKATCQVPSPPPASEQEPPPEGADRRAVPWDEKNLCEIADSNLSRVQARLLASKSDEPIVPRKPWNKKSKPRHLDRVDRRLSLTKEERALLSKNGFVVSPRWSFSNYAGAYHEIYQSQLPLYVSADSILHAIYVSNDQLIADIERRSLEPMLRVTLAAMRCKLAEGGYAGALGRDLDLYLTVAQSLLAGEQLPSAFGVDTSALLKAANGASGMAEVDLFGRPRIVDWSQYEPRGHYTKGLERYFRAAMWLSRLEFNLVSRSSRSSQPGDVPEPLETPREAVVALALSDLAARADMADNVNKLDEAWGLLAGRREDVTISDLAMLRKKGGIAELSEAEFPKLKAAIGSDFHRTARIHYMPEGSVELPAIATFLGPRIVPDTAAFRPLTHSEVKGRHMMGAADVAFVLGVDRAKTYLEHDLQKYPTLEPQLGISRKIIEQKGNDLYSIWLTAVRSAAKKADGTTPSYMDTDAYADAQMNTVVAGYAQMRHNYVLMAGQAYSEGGCEIPDGYVEPAIGTYDALIKYAERGAITLKHLDPKDETHASVYFGNLSRTLRTLRVIGQHELEGRALSNDEKMFLSMVAEITPGSSDGGPTYTGWYFDAFRTRQDDGLKGASFIADYFTSGFEKKVAYVGAGAPRLGVFVIDTGGEPRVAVGPIADAYETDGSVEKRLTDETAAAAPGKRSPWVNSFVASKPATFDVKGTFSAAKDNEARGSLAIAFQKSPGLVTIELLDHHRVVIERLQRNVTATTLTATTRTPYPSVAGFRVRVGSQGVEAFAGVGDVIEMQFGDWPLPPEGE